MKIFKKMLLKIKIIPLLYKSEREKYLFSFPCESNLIKRIAQGTSVFSIQQQDGISKPSAKMAVADNDTPMLIPWSGRMPGR